MEWIVILAVCILLCAPFILGQGGNHNGGKGNNNNNNAQRKKKRAKCAHLWRPDNLPGKCFGLRPYQEFGELKDVKKVTSATECKALCCILGEQCVTWQYQNATSKCSLGPAVRLGFEGADTPNWCDPHPPGEWSGNRITARNADGTCSWGPDLRTQCFGLGPEKFKNIAKNIQYNTEECRQACCNDKTCDVYQEMPGRGCYFNVGKDVWCSQPETEFIGGRKCVPGFCGGKEQEILGKRREVNENLDQN